MPGDVCSQCGTLIDAGDPSGLCAKCGVAREGARPRPLIEHEGDAAPARPIGPRTDGDEDDVRR